MKIEQIPDATEPPAEPQVSPEEARAELQRERAEQAALPYAWRQTLQDVTITVPLPAGTRGRDLSVTISRRAISAGLRGSSPPFIEGALFNDVVADECTWSVVDQRELVVTLDKANQTEWWPHVVEGAPKIDVRRIEPENSKLSDLDGETRAMVEKMMVSQLK